MFDKYDAKVQRILLITVTLPLNSVKEPKNASGGKILAVVLGLLFSHWDRFCLNLQIEEKKNRTY